MFRRNIKHLYISSMHACSLFPHTTGIVQHYALLTVFQKFTDWSTVKSLPIACRNDINVGNINTRLYILRLTTIKNPLIMRLTSPMLQNRITITSTSIKIARPATPMIHPADPNVCSPSAVFANAVLAVPSRLRVPTATAAATSAGSAATWGRTGGMRRDIHVYYLRARIALHLRWLIDSEEESPHLPARNWRSLYRVEVPKLYLQLLRPLSTLVGCNNCTCTWLARVGIEFMNPARAFSRAPPTALASFPGFPAPEREHCVVQAHPQTPHRSITAWSGNETEWSFVLGGRLGAALRDTSFVNLLTCKPFLCYY